MFDTFWKHQALTYIAKKIKARVIRDSLRKQDLNQQFVLDLLALESAASLQG